MTKFYNTVGIKGAELKQAVQAAEKQEAAILIIYQSGQPFSPSQVFTLCQRAGHTWLITSIRRGITNLTKDGKLVKTKDMRPGLYNMNEHLWVIAKNVGE